MQFVGRIYENGSVSYCSKIKETRAEAAEACFKARPKSLRCMVSEARYNDSLKETVPTHDGVQWVDRPKTRPATWLAWLRPRQVTRSA
jgi:hypothetical protein